MTWLKCGTDFIVGDVIRWKEPIWKPQLRRSKRKPVMIGQRLIAGQVLKMDRYGWVHIEVASCSVLPFETWGKPIPGLKRGEVIRRRRAKIGQGRLDRLAWSDESARAAIVGSRFF